MTRANLARLTNRCPTSNYYRPLDLERKPSLSCPSPFACPRPTPSIADSPLSPPARAQVTESAFFRSIPPSHPLILSNSAGIHAQSIGEHIIMSLLMLQHRIAEPLRIGSQEKRWASPQELGGLHISELRGKVVGMLPYGAVSREVARMASAFGARIVGEQACVGCSVDAPAIC